MSERNWAVVRKGSIIGGPATLAKTYRGMPIVAKGLTREEAKQLAARRRKLLSPGEKSYYHLGYSIVQLRNPGAAWHEAKAESLVKLGKSHSPGSIMRQRYLDRSDAHSYSAEVSKRLGMPNPKKKRKVTKKTKAKWLGPVLVVGGILAVLFLANEI